MSHPLAAGILAGERRALARAITLVESTRVDHRREAEALLGELLPHTGNSVRVGLSGTPGVGKSSFVEALGKYLTARGMRVAVLAVDPSSTLSGGSILGDKTRMERLARDPAAFIRPSPSGGTLGGVARRTREAMLLCEAAGFEAVLVETVGVGQSETAVAGMVDMFLLLLAPAGGDELQGIKRGIMELADVVVVNKADGDLERIARLAASEYTNALHYMRPKSRYWLPEVLLASALEERGIAEAWDAVERHQAALGASGETERRRRSQARAWLWDEVREQLFEALNDDPDVRAQVGWVEGEVGAGSLLPVSAARRLLHVFRHETPVDEA